MNYDVVIMNPPYGNGLHEKFLEKAIDITDQYMLSVEPAAWLLGKKQKKNITDKVNQYHAEITTIVGNKYFDAAIGGTMSINFIDKKGRKGITFDGKQYEKCEQISLTSNDELLEKFKQIIKPLYEKDNLHNHMLKNGGEKNSRIKIENNPNPEWWIYRSMPYAGNSVQRSKDIGEFYAFISKLPYEKVCGQFKNLNTIIKNNKKFLDYYFPFNTEQELKNFWNYIHTDFARMSLYFNKGTIDLRNGELKGVPYFDFSDPIFRGTPAQIDERLFKKYNISSDIVEHIHEILPDYYNIRK